LFTAKAQGASGKDSYNSLSFQEVTWFIRLFPDFAVNDVFFERYI
jgi:hypothetical protein